MRAIRILSIWCLSAAAAAAQPAAPAPAAIAGESLNAVVWTQHSAEYRALCRQTFAMARRALRAALADPHWTAATEQQEPFAALPPAIILDLDETVLDNSAFQARLALEGLPYTDARWQAWVAEGRALAIPGAAEFLQFVHSSGVRPFYVTNRVCTAAETDPTLSLLRRLHFPVLPSSLLCKTGTSNKTERRAAVAGTHRILLLLGDDLNDFVPASLPGADWRARVEARERLADAHLDQWGDRWFVLPNPMYGSWERAIGATAAEKRDSLRH